MALVKITNGETTLHVTYGAFLNSYKNCGFSIVEDDAVEAVVEEINEDVVAPEKTEFDELLAKPISSWSKEELKKYTLANNIDTSTAKTAQDVKDLVKKFIDESV